MIETFYFDMILLPDIYSHDGGAISFGDHLASMDPKIKEGGLHGVFGSCTRATNDLGE